MIITDVVTLEFVGDGRTKSFDVRIEGIPLEPEGKNNFVVTRLVDGDETATILQYGIGYRYAAHFNPRGFSEYFTLELASPLPAGERIVVLRTTPVIGVSQYPDSGVPPKKAERDFDHIIKILQEYGYLIKGLREDLEAEIVARKEGDEELARAIEEEARIREEADNALGGRIDQFGDPQKILDAVDIILDMSGELQGSVRTIYFVSDGAATQYRVPGPVVGRDILLMAFETATRRKIYFAEKTELDGSITLELAQALPDGVRFGVVYLRAVDEGARSTLVRYIHTQATPAATWSITHDIVKGYPRLFILNDAGQVMVGGENWTAAPSGTLTLAFGAPVAGVAILTGFPADSGEAAETRHVHTQTVPAATWVIAHDLVKEYPRVFLLDAAGRRVFGAEDWTQASSGILTLTFGAPLAGVAMLSLF